VGADGRGDGGAQLIGEVVAGFHDDEERHPVTAVRQFRADDEAFADAGEGVDHHVDVGAAQPDACRLSVEPERPETTTPPRAVRVIQSPCRHTPG
jgi:hypothetical protein